MAKLAEISGGDGWRDAEQKLFAAHVAGKLVLCGRAAPHFGANPTGEAISIPREFFSSREIRVGLANVLHHRSDARRIMYCEVAIRVGSVRLSMPLRVPKPKRKPQRQRTKFGSR